MLCTLLQDALLCLNVWHLFAVRKWYVLVSILKPFFYFFPLCRSFSLMPSFALNFALLPGASLRRRRGLALREFQNTSWVAFSVMDRRVCGFCCRCWQLQTPSMMVFKHTVDWAIQHLKQSDASWGPNTKITVFGLIFESFCQNTAGLIVIFLFFLSNKKFYHLLILLFNFWMILLQVEWIPIRFSSKRFSRVGGVFINGWSWLFEDWSSAKHFYF